MMKSNTIKRRELEECTSKYLAFGRYQPIEGRSYNCYIVVPNLIDEKPEYKVVAPKVLSMKQLAENLYLIKTVANVTLVVLVI